MNFLEKISFNRSERNAIICLITIALIGFGYNIILKPRVQNQVQIKHIEEILSESEVLDSIEEKPFPIKEIKEKIATIISSENKKKNDKQEKKIKKAKSITYKSFNPNTIDSITWLQLGVPSYNIKTIQNFKNKGGQFYQCTDLLKIYGMDSSLVEKLIPYCQITSSSKKTNYKKTNYKVQSKININTADTAELKKLYGIGSKLSKRIIKYRERIGGFHSINQLKEVWGVEENVITDNAKILICDGITQKININSISQKKLSKHIFFDYKQAKIITNYRNQHGTFKDLIELKEIVTINDSIYNKIIPYLTLD